MTATLHADIARLRRTNPRIFTRPLPERLRTWGLWLGFVAVLAFGLWWIDASPMRIVNGLNKLGLLVTLMIVSAVGLGPFAGVLAIAVGDVMVFGKLFAEAIENVDNKPVDGVRASGGDNIHVVRLGVFPQVLPVMMSHVLYFFESNVRSATILGIVGAGGIGLQLSDRISINNWQEAAFIILMILVTVAIIDAISRRIRARLI